eukprot:TRINITY_DN7855_c0_g2_i4.p1 TRINITY_DN7855_c0_g2~~TRINITY_DN7855_c0_g2_i4.p1  ORF type:complete len:177 (-),score=44.44 TRINITY_DN7855_c0_g2_i4:21-551(-)
MESSHYGPYEVENPFKHVSGIDQVEIKLHDLEDPNKKATWRRQCGWYTRIFNEQYVKEEADKAREVAQWKLHVLVLDDIYLFINGSSHWDEDRDESLIHAFNKIPAIKSKIDPLPQVQHPAAIAALQDKYAEWMTVNNRKPPASPVLKQVENWFCKVHEWLTYNKIKAEPIDTSKK